MKRMFSVLLLAGIAPIAGAHTLDGGLFTALGHELFGSHHLPLTLFLVVVGLVLFRSCKKRVS